MLTRMKLKTARKAAGVGSRLCGDVRPVRWLPCLPGGAAAPQPVYMHAQRWGGGFKANLAPERCLLDEGAALAACGDFCIESSAQGALLSGLAAGQAMARLMAQRS